MKTCLECLIWNVSQVNQSHAGALEVPGSLSGVKLFAWAPIMALKYDEDLFSRSYIDRISDKKVIRIAKIITWGH